MINLYLIRHAECITNTTPEFVGGRSSDSPLSEKGRQQANALCLAFKRPFEQGWTLERPFDQIFCSTAKRAIETQEISTGWITQCYDIQPVYSKELEEMDQGDWEGRVRSEVYTTEIYKQIEADPLNFKAPNAESKYDVGIRMNNFIWDNILFDAPRQEETKVAIFTHGFAIKCWLYTVLQFLPSMIYHFKIDNTSITNLCYYPEHPSHWDVKYINRLVSDDWRA